jgi:hypothetical protein
MLYDGSNQIGTLLLLGVPKEQQESAPKILDCIKIYQFYNWNLYARTKQSFLGNKVTEYPSLSSSSEPFLSIASSYPSQQLCTDTHPRDVHPHHPSQPDTPYSHSPL